MPPGNNAEQFEDQVLAAEDRQLQREVKGREKARKKKEKKKKTLGDLGSLVDEGTVRIAEEGDVMREVRVRAEKVRDDEVLNAQAEAEAAGREDRWPKVETRETEKIDTDGALPGNADVAIVKTVFENTERIEVEAAERDKRVKYLAEGLGNDLKMMFGEQTPEPEKAREIAARLRENKVGPFVANRSEVQKVVTTLDEFMAMDDGYPKGWRALEDFLNRFGITREDIVEARKRKDKLPKGPEVLREEKRSPEVKETKELKGKDEVVWYNGILEDLKWITYLDKELVEEISGQAMDQLPLEERNNRLNLVYEEKRGRARNLRSRGIKLPELSTDIEDKDAFAARQDLRAAIEFLKGGRVSGSAKKIWADRKEAVAFLNGLGIGDFEGVDYLPGSKDERQVALSDKKDGLVEEDEEKRVMELLEDRPDLQIAWKLSRDSEFRKKPYFMVVREKLRAAGVTV